MTEFKSQHSSPFKITSIDQKGLFSGYASVFDVVDQHNDVVLPGAFSKSIQLTEQQIKWPKMLWQHNQSEPIGRWLYFEEDSKGLYVEGQLLFDVQRAKEAYALMKSGAVDGLSIGYSVSKSARDPKTDVRFIRELYLHEISVVTFAANREAQITRVKSDWKSHS